MTEINATHLFENANNNCPFPRSSESFWTAVFALFLLHMANRAPRIRVWKPKPNASHGPWYRRAAEDILISGLTAQGVIVEPKSLVSLFPQSGAEIAGISPDIAAYDRGDLQALSAENVFAEARRNTR